MRKKIYLLLIVSLVCFLKIPQLNAQEASSGTTGNYFVSPSLFYSSDLQQKNSKADSSLLLFDMRFGMNISDTFFAGLIYGIDNKTVKTSGYQTAANNYDNKYERTSYGPFVAYFFDPFFLIFNYYFSSTWKVTSKSEATGSSTDTYSGFGYQFDFGFRVPVWSMHIGPVLSYKVFDYSQIKSGGSTQSLSPHFRETKIEPALSLWVTF